MATPINTIYSWFETGDFPTQAQFQASWSSFWHKDEAIPMTNISGLSDQFGKFVLGSTFNTHLSDQNAHPYFAKKDASNLTPTNVNDWKAKLGVGDLPENIATYDYDLHDHVMMKDGTTKEATNLGKNIANSSLTSVTGAGLTLGAPYTWNTASQPFSITGLPDKSNDATFDRIKVQNTSGQEAILTNPYNVLKKGFGLMTAEQALELGQLLNGGVGSGGNISVNLISPPIVEKIDSNEYILLRGANLKLSDLSKKIEILDAVTKAVVVQVPNSQVQVYTDGLSLIFYYNFKDLPYNNYLIRITSGAKIYDTTLTISVVQNVTDANVDLLTWEAIYATPENNLGSNILSGRNVSITTLANGGVQNANNFSIGLKSSEIFPQGDNFYLEMSVDISLNRPGYDNYGLKSRIGLGYSSTGNAVANNSLVSLGFNYSGNPFNYGYFYNNNINNFIKASADGVLSINVVFIKTGNLFRTIVNGSNDSTIIANNSGYSIFMAFVNRRVIQSCQVQIIKAYTFN